MDNLSYNDFKNNRSASELSAFEAFSENTKSNPVDPENPSRPGYDGIFRAEVKVKGITRCFFVHIPTYYPCSGIQLIILADNGQTAADIMVDTPWVDIAEEQSFVLVAAEPLNGKWDTENTLETEVAYLEAIYDFSMSRQLYGANGSYMVGYGSGGYAGQIFAAKNSHILAGFVSAGGGGVSSGLLDSLGAEPSIGDAKVPRREVPLPVWIIQDKEECKASIRYWEQVNRTDEYVGDNGMAKVSQPSLKRFGSFINSQPVDQVWVSVIPGAARNYESGFTSSIWSFLQRAKRHVGITLNDMLRPRRTWQDMGLKRYTAVVDGRLREWYVYVPSAYRKHPGVKLPLVMCIHGYMWSGELFAGESEWYKVAEERDFFAVFPSAFRGGGLHSKSANAKQPEWNSSRPFEKDTVDDIKFIKHVLTEVEKEYPVDPERKYCTGHSNGSAMTQCLMFNFANGFTAYNPVGCNLNDLQPDRPLPRFKDKIPVPVWIIKAEFDRIWGVSLAEESTNHLLIKHLCAEYGINPEQKPSCLVNGRFTTHTFLDGAGIPFIKFTGLRAYPHCYTPEISWMVWDQFFCHYRRKRDGPIEFNE